VIVSRDRPPIIILARGAEFVTGMNRGGVDTATPYLHDFLRFIGVHSVRFVAVAPIVGAAGQATAARLVEFAGIF